MKEFPITESEYQSLARAAVSVDIFAPLKGAFLDRLLARIELCGFEPGEAVFQKGDPGEAFYIIHEGHIKIRFKTGLFWLFRKVLILGPGDFFGEMALLEGRPHSATVIATEPLKLFVLRRKDFAAVL